MARSFNCTNCGMDGALVGIVNIDSRGMTPCPVCRTPVMVLTGDAPAQTAKSDSFLNKLVAGIFGGVIVGCFTAGIIHAALWFIFSIDVVEWGWTPAFGFRLSYVYLGFIALWSLHPFLEN